MVAKIPITDKEHEIKVNTTKVEAQALYKKLLKEGYSKDQVLVFSSALIDCITESIEEERANPY